VPKQVEPLSVIRPATEIATSARVKLMRAKKHVKKLNNPIADVLIENACKATSSLESYLKKQLEAEKRLKNASKESI
jgi:hypothetical protein